MSNHKIQYLQVTEKAEILQILELQKRYLPHALSSEEAVEDGFLTIEHNEAVLLRMNEPHSHIIAVHSKRVIGYCLVMTIDHRHEFPVVRDMFVKLEGLRFKGQPISEIPYFVMGQVCIEKAFRGMGVFEGMYQKLQSCLSSSYRLCITEVSRKNQRSLRAHLKVGFEVILSYEDSKGHPWELIVWEW